MLADLNGRVRGLRRERFYFLGDNRETSAAIAGARGFNRRTATAVAVLTSPGNQAVSAPGGAVQTTGAMARRS
ncbi:hypothetical protein ABIB85_007654 [Bradyrhizobium sp. JR1.5]